MKRKTIFGLMAGLAIVSTFLVKEPMKVDAAQTVNSPTLNCITYKRLEKGDHTGLTEYSTITEHTDNSLVFKVNGIRISSDEKIFVVVKNKVKKESIFQGFLTDVSGTYSTKINLPYYCDSVEIEVYKQNSGDKDYTVKAENLLGITKEYVGHILDYKLGEGTPIIAYDRNWAVTPDENKTVLTRITPNYFTLLDLTNDNKFDRIGKIILPEGQEDLLTEDEKIVQSEVFVPDKAPMDGTEWENAVTRRAKIFNFRFPKKVSEFKFVVYVNNITDRKEDIIVQYHIKLENRK